MAPSDLSEIHPATRPHMPLDLVSEILARLPVGTLQRFRCVSKAWRDTISDDPSFHRAHLHHQRRKDPWLLIAPEFRSKAYDHIGRCSTFAGWYRWEEGQSDVTSAVVYAPDSPWLFSKAELRHKFTHCDGLVLVPAETTVRVFNPATRRAVELPRSPHSMASPGRDFYIYQTFGLGHDPRTDTYKVVRLFRRELTVGSSLRAEVFTIGTDRDWRETAAQPRYPFIAGGTATYCKGTLFWTVGWVHRDGDAATQSLISFSLKDESFNVLSTPVRINSACILAELRGELCVAHLGPDGRSLEMWMCGDFVGGVNPPQWYRRDITNVLTYPSQRCPRPLAAFHEGSIFIECERSNQLYRYDAQTRKCEDLVWMRRLKFQDPENDEGIFIVECVISFDVIPYIPSLVPI